jgi:hypothetical protein
MSVDTLLISGFLLALLIGAVIGSILLFRNPSNWLGFAKLAVDKLKPIVFSYMLKRMDPKDEEAWRKCQLRGGKWDHRRKRCI